MNFEQHEYRRAHEHHQQLLEAARSKRQLQLTRPERQAHSEGPERAVTSLAARLLATLRGRRSVRA